MTWEPPSPPRGPRLSADACPHCGAHKVYAEPRGTFRVCMACEKRVTPPGVLAPYERGTEVTRAAKSQRERDLEALDLAGRKGVMLGELRKLAAGDGLGDASVMKVEWFADQVKSAPNGARLDDLADLFAAERIKPRGWLQRPVSITAGYEDGEDGEDDYPDDDDQDDADAVLATPATIAAQQHRAQPARMTWAEALAVCGLRIAPELDGCQATERGWQCSGNPTRNIGGAFVCGLHYEAVAAVISNSYRQQWSA